MPLACTTQPSRNPPLQPCRPAYHRSTALVKYRRRPPPPLYSRPAHPRWIAHLFKGCSIASSSLCKRHRGPLTRADPRSSRRRPLGRATSTLAYSCLANPASLRSPGSFLACVATLMLFSAFFSPPNDGTPFVYLETALAFYIPILQTCRASHSSLPRVTPTSLCPLRVLVPLLLGLHP